MKTKKTYVITGATSGIGNAIVAELCKNNIVFAGYRDERKLHQSKVLKHKNVRPFYIDMTDVVSIDNAANFIKSETKKVDTLINAAGCVVAGAVEEVSIGSVRNQFEVNTFSHLDFTQKLLPILTNGKIINISSMASFGVFPFVAPYCASKRALDILFNSLQVEYGNKIKVISIKPGVIATPLWDKSIDINASLLSNNKKYEKEYKYLVENAKKNAKNGLNVEKVVKTVLKADSSEHPKSSYLVGTDAVLASMFSHLPQGLINKVLELGMKIKIK